MTLSMKDVIPGTPDYLAYHAVTRPDAIAVIDRDQSITFRQFHEDLCRVSRVVGSLGLTPGTIVAVEWDCLYRHWLFILALECHGIASASFPAGNASFVFGPLLKRVALVVHAGDAPAGLPRTLRTDEAWWKDALSRPPHLLPSTRPADAILRIACSSGTTGSAKFMAATGRQIEFRRQSALWQFGYSNTSRFLVSTGFPVQADYRRACTCLRAGGTVVHAGSMPVWEALEQTRATHVVLMPNHLSLLLDRSGTAPDIHGLNISAVGGRVPARVRQHLRETMAATIVENYGANETGAIAQMDASGTGTVLPGVQIEIVDDADSPVPVGQEGRVRIRSPGCIGEYLFEPEATARKFKDGWFYPGDIGALQAPSRLRLRGREDDLLNVRGLKVNAAILEAELRKIPAISDIALSTRLDDHGIEALRVALVLEDGFGIQDFQREIPNHLPASFGRIFFVELNQIPRTASGKVRRAALKAELDRRG